MSFCHLASLLLLMAAVAIGLLSAEATTNGTGTILIEEALPNIGNAKETAAFRPANASQTSPGPDEFSASVLEKSVPAKLENGSSAAPFSGPIMVEPNNTTDLTLAENGKVELMANDRPELLQASPEDGVEDTQDSSEEENATRPPPALGFDYLNVQGTEIVDKQALDMELLYLSNPGREITINTWVTSPQKAPFKLPFSLDHEPGTEGACQEAGKTANRRSLVLSVCPKEEATPGQCPDGFILCYTGQLDPENRALDYLWRLHTNTSMDLGNFCEQNAKHLLGQAGKEGKLHALRFKIVEQTDTAGVKKLMLTIEGSFLSITQTLEMPATGCVDIELGTDSRLWGGVKDEPLKAFQHAEQQLTNAIRLEWLPVLRSFPVDLLAFFSPSAIGHLSFHGTDQCNLVVRLSGKNLLPCREQTCKEDFPVVQSVQEDKIKLYKKHFKNMVLVEHSFTQDELPEGLGDDGLKGRFFMEKDPKGKPRAIFGSKGKEFVFAVLTKDEKPPVIQVVRPPHDKYCLKQGMAGCQANEFILAYNGRPDCFARFCWGQQKLFVRDEMNNVGEVLSIKDKSILVEGPGQDEFNTVDQFNSNVSLGRGTCGMEGDKLPTKIGEFQYTWRFILNEGLSKKGVKARVPDCPMMAVAFNLEDYMVMLPKTLAGQLPTKKP